MTEWHWEGDEAYYCEECDSFSKEEWNYCIYCGTSLVEEDEDEEEEEDEEYASAKVHQIVHLSDLHIDRIVSSAREWVFGSEETVKIAKRVIKDISSRYPKAHVIVTGDITNDGKDSQFKKAKSLLRPLMKSGKLTVVPGNHDLTFNIGRIYFESPYANLHFHFYDCFHNMNRYKTTYEVKYPIVKHISKDIVVIGLDSTSGYNNPLGHLRGHIGHEQLEALDDILDRPAIKRKVKVVIFHHHLYQTGNNSKLVDAEKLRKVMEGRVQIVLCGHQHYKAVWKNKRSINIICTNCSSVDADKDDPYCWYGVITIKGKNNIKHRWEKVDVSGLV